MPRLPVPGSDENTWGDILNEYLSVEHNSDGTLKPTGSLADKYTKPAGGIPKSDLSSGVQTSLDAADTANTYTDSEVASHASAADPHASAAYAIMVGGGRRIFVQATDPGGSAQNGDLWIDTS
ncbi:MAG: hypothetical protein ACREGJ_03555 [Candidatus Saccharimonadales bacterium]